MFVELAKLRYEISFKSLYISCHGYNINSPINEDRTEATVLNRPEKVRPNVSY